MRPVGGLLRRPGPAGVGLLGLAAVAWALGGVMQPAAAETSLAAGPGAVAHYVGGATAVGVQTVIDSRPALLPVTAPASAYSPYAETGYDGAGAGRAATYFPGDGVVTGLPLLCQTAGCPFTLPPYPLLATAAYPSHPSAHVDGPGLVGDPAGAAAVQPGPASATAGPDRAQAEAAASRSSGLAGALQMGPDTTTATSQVLADGLHQHAESRLSDTTVGGVLHIGSLVAVSDTVVAVGTQAHDSTSVVASGVTVAGQPVTVDGTGVHPAGGPGVVTPAAQKVLDGVLADHGLSVRAVDGVRQDGVGSVTSRAGGLVVGLALPVSGLPRPPGLQGAPVGAPDPNRTYVATVLLGGAATVAQATGEAGFTDQAGAPPSPVTAGPAGSGSGPTAATVAAPAANGATAAGHATSPSGGDEVTTSAGTAARSVGFSTLSLRLVALGFALLAVLSLLGRLWPTARLARSP